MISRFYQKLVKFLEDKNSKIAYRINIQMFPLTQLSPEQEDLCFGKNSPSSREQYEPPSSSPRNAPGQSRRQL